MTNQQIIDAMEKARDALEVAKNHAAYDYETARQKYERTTSLSEAGCLALRATSYKKLLVEILDAKLNLTDAIEELKRMGEPVDEARLIARLTEVLYRENNPCGNGNGQPLYRFQARTAVEYLRPYLRTPQPSELSNEQHTKV